ncbi:PD-(D/E)XK nuclease-like domain-containing protein [Salmonella enterica]|nr:exonuclease VIII [Salmonella enterica]EGX8325150.1 exonuclease VIII [Salmonella enterica subsp. enterica serovar Javiana]EJA5032657.1 PD-(D/E)XK nuclease-like domain-containing protein [Salmonella enterica]EJC0357362.1 PD-(D/E)XK nuclease-like domain-containing protein [Salmonella enterica]EJC0659233.1 PD-(D/E)XK nuclease-like domain-containing protein [Salmonella enterica]
MSKQQEYPLLYPVKNEGARKRLGFSNGFYWKTDESLARVILRANVALMDAGFNLEDFKKPVRINFPVENDIPPEGVFDTTFCKNRELGGADGKTLVIIPGKVSAVASDEAESTDSADSQEQEAITEAALPQLTVVATMPLRHRVLAQLVGNGEYLYHVDAAQKAEILRLEMDTENARVQNMILAAENVEPFKKAIEHDIHRVVVAFNAVFPADGKTPELGTIMQFFNAWFGTDHIDRGLLVKEWKKGKRVSGISRTPSGANAGGGILTDRGEDFIHDKASLSRDVATGVLARSMDVDIYNLHPAHAKRIEEIIAENKPPFSVFRDKFINMPGGLDYSRAIVVASVKEAPVGIEAIPARVGEYLNRVLTETNHVTPDQLIVDIACGRTSAPMPYGANSEGKSDDEEKSQSSVVLADEQAAPETVEPDTTEHHQDTQPLDAQSQVNSVDAKYQKLRAELHEARKNIPPKNPVDADKLLAASHGEFVEGISDPNDPKWLHENYSTSASNEGEKTEVQTGHDEETPKETAGDSVQEDNEGAQSDSGCDSTGDASDTVVSAPLVVPNDIQPGIYFDISNEAYHAGPGVSKSQLDDIAVCPAFYQWRKAAPVDTEKTKALDMGTALHCRLLEPDEFKNRFVIAPAFNRRTNAGKEEEKEFMQHCLNSGKTVMTAEEGRKLNLMFDSVMAHPGARALLEAEGKTESSIYWRDTNTGELCRIRPDKFLANTAMLLDVKKIADMSRFARHVEEFRYHVQAAMYCEGWKVQTGETPRFSFLAVSENIECGRYPVHLYILEDEHHDVGYALFRRDLDTYHQCVTSGKWGWGFEIIERPYWARG